MKQVVTITIKMTLDEEDEDSNYSYAHEIAGEILEIANQDDCRARVDVDLD